MPKACSTVSESSLQYLVKTVGLPLKLPSSSRLYQEQSLVSGGAHILEYALTKDELSKGNGALEELLRTSRFALWDEDDELARRKENPSAKGRSKKAATALRNEAMSLLSSIHANINLGELLNCTTHDQFVQSNIYHH